MYTTQGPNKTYPKWVLVPLWVAQVTFILVIAGGLGYAMLEISGQPDLWGKVPPYVLSSSKQTLSQHQRIIVSQSVVRVHGLRDHRPYCRTRRDGLPIIPYSRALDIPCVSSVQENRGDRVALRRNIRRSADDAASAHSGIFGGNGLCGNDRMHDVGISIPWSLRAAC